VGVDGRPGYRTWAEATQVVEDRIRVTKTTRIWTVVVGLLVTGGLVGAFAAGRVSSASQQAAIAVPPSPSTLTAVVEAGPLKKVVHFSGKVTFPAGTILRATAAPASMKAVVTKVAVTSGQTVRGGELLAEISGRPLFLLEGQFPLYRELHAGDQGSDVTELQLGLRKVFGLPHVTGTFDSDTERAVRRLYSGYGYRPPEIAATPPPSAAPSNSGSAGPTVSKSPSGSSVGLSVSQAEILFVSKLPLRIASVTARVGGDGTGDIATTSLGSPHIEAEVPAVDQYDVGLWKPGISGTVQIGARRFPVSFSEVSHPATPATTGQQPQAGAQPSQNSPERVLGSFSAPVTVLSQAGGRPVAVDVVEQEAPADTVVVPVSALWTDSSGTTAVQVLADAKRLMAVRVSVRLVVDGMAAVSAREGNLRPGARVVIGYEADTNPAGVDISSVAVTP
jgi:hypothetical protein